MSTRTGPIADTAAARALGAALRRVGYDEDGITGLLGDEALGSGPEDAPVHLRRLPDTKLAVAIRLLFLEQPVPVAQATDALGRRAVDALAATRLAGVSRKVVPRARILPLGRLLVASDLLDVPWPDPPDYVATYTPTSHLCAALTPRPRVARALDVGTGNGVHALLAARHARRVVATDVNPRALAYAEINAALNNLKNLEFRLGDLFEPVTGETFDLITCNAPFVVSPENRFAYRDGGLRGDELGERVVASAAEHLADGGYATLLVSWIADEGDGVDDHAVAWATASGCDAWILRTELRTPLEHAAEWNAPLADDAAAFEATLDDWARYCEDIGAATISEGAILLHRRAGRRAPVRVDEVAEDDLAAAGEQIRRAFDNRARIAALRRRRDLLSARVAPAMALTIEADVEPKRGRAVVARARIHLAEGTGHRIDAPRSAIDVVPALGGGEPLREHLGRLPPLERRRALALAEELLEVGALRFADGTA